GLAGSASPPSPVNTAAAASQAAREHLTVIAGAASWIAGSSPAKTFHEVETPSKSSAATAADR
ncbi:MAG: hypothetical protein P1U37_05645, partial [Minwuia sp.]|nr:hypothetical protein [Minwuia sp.]